MKPLVPLIAVVLAATAGPAWAQTAQSWSPVTAREGSIRAVNVPSVTVDGQRRTFETLDVYAVRRDIGGVEVDYVRARYRMDCRDKTSLMLDVQGYLADGSQVVSGEAPADQRPAAVPEGSIAAEMLDAVCAEGWMVVQYRSVEGFLRWAREGGIAEWNDPSW